jgi:PAS domain S-box-containing protein
MDANVSFLFDHSNDFLCVTDKSGTILHTNVALRIALGYDEEDINGTNAEEFFHPTDKKSRVTLLNKLTPGKQITNFKSRVRAKNGRYHLVNWSLTLNGDDNLVYATGINLTAPAKPTAELNITEKIERIVENFNEGFFIVDRNWKITSFNAAFQAIVDLAAEQLKDMHIGDLKNLGINDEVMADLEVAFGQSVPSSVQFFNSYLNKWLRLNIYPYKNDITFLVRDITSIKVQQLILALEKSVLESNASATILLPQTIDELLTGVEEIFPDMYCSVLEVDDAQEKIYHLSGPRLPREYTSKIDGAPIGPKAGSCGTSVYHRSQIIVSNIETSPYWEDYKHLVLPHGLKACWSTPIINSRNSKVLATFAIYYTAAREPNPDELQIIDRTVNLLRILMENKKNQDHLHEQHRRLEEIAAISSHDLRRPVATILGLMNLYDRKRPDNPLNREIVNHLETTTRELDEVIHTIVEKTVFLKAEE